MAHDEQHLISRKVNVRTMNMLEKIENLLFKIASRVCTISDVRAAHFPLMWFEFEMRARGLTSRFYCTSHGCRDTKS